MANMNDNWKLARVVLVEEKNKNTFRLHTEYFVTDKHGNTDRFIIDSIPLYFRDKPLLEFNVDSEYGFVKSTVDLGFGELEFDKKTKITEERIVTTKKKMTVEEIEKALGYKVEIISEKEENISCNTCKHEACPGNLDPCLCCCSSKDAYAKWERKDK